MWAKLRSLATVLLCIGILAGAVVVIALLKAAKPKAVAAEAVKTVPTVEVLPVAPSEVSLQIPTQGVVVAARETQIASEVSGRIIWVSPKFKAGGRFNKEEEILRIDPADYEAILAQSEANLASARLSLATEEARAAQARRDWNRLGNAGTPNDLTLRKPQVESAKSSIKATEAALAKAKRDLERTIIRAPFSSLLAQTQTELGSFVTLGASIARLLADAPYEVRLPLSVDEFSLMPPQPIGAKTTFRAEAGGTEYAWEGKILRQEGQVDRTSRSLFLVAEVSPNSTEDLLQPGLFLQATIQGRVLPQVYRIPNQALRGENTLLLVDEEDRLQLQEVTVVRKEEHLSLVSSGLDPGDRVCLTALDVVVEGLAVSPQEIPELPAADQLSSPPRT
ncbi:MAG: efflux RND transporter periplasmic adaptor subunit [Verrucomicrobiota bacterium]